jgi:hypothetical protein
VPIALPDESTLVEFEVLVGILMEQYECNVHESECLAALRDTLLPRIMSSELSVADVDGRMVSAPTGDIGGRMVSAPTGEETPDERVVSAPTGEETPDGRMVSAPTDGAALDGRMVSAPTGESGIVGADIIRQQTNVAAK